MHPRRDEAIALRKQGLSFKEIEKKLDIYRSTLSYMLRKIKLTAEQQARLEKRSEDNKKRFVKKFSGKNPEGSRKGGLNVWKQHRATCLANLEHGRLQYYAAQLPIKEKLEDIHSDKFQKEQIGDHIFTYCSKKHIIEVTTDAVSGFYVISRRFEDIALGKKDLRQKIFYLDMTKLTSLYASRLAANGVEFRDYREVLGEPAIPEEKAT